MFNYVWNMLLVLNHYIFTKLDCAIHFCKMLPTFLNLNSYFPSNARGRKGNSKCQIETPTLRYLIVMVLERQSQSRNFLRPLQPKSWHILKLDNVINYLRNILLLFLIAFNPFGGKPLSNFFKNTISPQTLTKN